MRKGTRREFRLDASASNTDSEKVAGPHRLACSEGVRVGKITGSISSAFLRIH